MSKEINYIKNSQTVKKIEAFKSMNIAPIIIMIYSQKCLLIIVAPPSEEFWQSFRS